jgi:hypothetical protein
MKKSVKIKIALEIAMSVLTVSSLAVSTYAWFAMQDTAKIDFFSMHVPEDVTCSLKYYSGNFDVNTSTYPGYKDPRVLSNPSKASTVTDYNTQFVAIPGNQFVANGPLDLQNLQPGVCHTYAAEVTSGNASSLTFDLTQFLAPISATRRIKEGSSYTSKGITLASAIDIYAESFPLSADNATNTANANSFITTYMEGTPVDTFTYFDTDTTTPSYTVATGSISATTGLLIVFTIEFTNLPATFYAYNGPHASDADSTSSYDYYTRSSSGDSNCYAGLSFKIQTLTIHKN